MKGLALVNFVRPHPARGFEWGRKRLQQSLQEHQWPGDCVWLDDVSLCNPVEVPFAFKPAAVVEAARRGYSKILWVDSSVVLQRFPTLTLECLWERPLTITPQQEPMCHTPGQWASDKCLAQHKLSRDQGMGVPGLMAGFLGFNLDFPECRTFLAEWYAASLDGASFVGGWGRDTAPVSTDPRCLGHRHDQTVASILAHKHRLNPVKFQLLISDYHQAPTEWRFDYV